MRLLELETTGEFDRSMKRIFQSVRHADKKGENANSNRNAGRVAEPIFR